MAERRSVFILATSVYIIFFRIKLIINTSWRSITWCLKTPTYLETMLSLISEGESSPNLRSWSNDKEVHVKTQLCILNRITELLARRLSLRWSHLNNVESLKKNITQRKCKTYLSALHNRFSMSPVISSPSDPDWFAPWSLYSQSSEQGIYHMWWLRTLMRIIKTVGYLLVSILKNHAPLKTLKT